MKLKIWRLNRSEIEELIAKDFTNLRWCPAAPEHDYTYRRGFANYAPERVGDVLYARPKGYQGPLCDYEEPIIKEIKHKNWHKKRTRGYRWVSQSEIKTR